MISLRRILVVLGIVGAVLILGLFVGVEWLKSYVHSETFRHEVETLAGQAIGGTQEVKEIDWSLHDGVRLNGLQTKIVSPQGTVLMQVESVGCTYSLIALLHRQLDLEEVDVSSPKIILTQSPSSPSSSSNGPAPDATIPKSEQALPFETILELAKMSNGDIRIQDASGATKADLQGISLDANTAAFFHGGDVTGKMSVTTISLPENLTISNFSTPFTYGKGAFAVDGFQANAFTGQITGSYKLDPSAPSVLEVSVAHIDMAQLGEVAQPNSPTKMSGMLSLQSTWNKVETGALSGGGDLQISDGQLQGVVILNELATAFGLQEMNDPQIKSVDCHFEVADGTTHFSNLQVMSTVFDMSGAGVIDPKGNLSADMTMTLHPDAFKQIPGVTTHFFTKLPDGSGSIPFHLSGTAANPEADSMTKTFIQGSKIHKSIKKTFDNLFK